MRARLENEDGTFVAEVEAPDGIEHIRFGERLFVALSFPPGDDSFRAVEVYSAPVEGSKVEP